MIIFLAIFGAVIGFLIMITLGYVIGTYNSLVSNREDIRTQFSNIKTEYQRRADLFYNLVQATKSYKIFEKSTLKEVVEARAKGITGTIPAQIKKMGQLDGLFSKLLALVEAYPNLKSNEQHNKLMDEVRITEDRVNVARTGYNDEVREYNIIIQSFPSSIIANMFRFRKNDFFINEEESNKPVRIDLSWTPIT